MSKKLLVWLIEDDASLRWVLEEAMRRAGYRVRGFSDANGFLDAFRTEKPDVLITDIHLPGENGLSLLERVRSASDDLPVIVMTAHSDLDTAVDAYQGGAFEYLPKPFDIDEAVALVKRAAAGSGGKRKIQQAERFPSLLGRAAAMQDLFRSIGRLAASHMTVLITGESGTGKELVARALYEYSDRSDKPFVALNTAAIPSELLESELFGHERGAFTGAESKRHGRFEQADTGTLFLDEIGDMSEPLQTRLLRVLAEGEFYRVGGQESIRVDVRVIAATNQDLEQKIADGSFREDLYYRLNVVHLRVPPLRERREDISMLLQHYLQKSARELRSEEKTLSGETLEKLSQYDWPGNVRQLINVCRRLTALAPGREILPADLPEEFNTGGRAAERWTQDLSAWAEQQLG
ncbi:MAG: nitrogen regulation protein NR(I), partial [Gammaproteobacteria bacterium]